MEVLTSKYMREIRFCRVDRGLNTEIGDGGAEDSELTGLSLLTVMANSISPQGELYPYPLGFEGAVYGLLAVAIAITLLFLYLRVEKFEDRIPELMSECEKWLGEIQSSLMSEMGNATLSQQQKVDSVLSIASKFSAVKSISSKLDELETDNSKRVQADIVTAVLMVVAGIMVYLAGIPSLNSSLFGITFIVALLAAIFWGVGCYSFYNTTTKLSGMKRSIRKRKDASP